MSGASTRDRKPPRIRWSEVGDRPVIAEINRKAFEHAYSGIFGTRRDRGNVLEPTAAVVQLARRSRGDFRDAGCGARRRAGGIAGLFLLKDGNGELAALYVLPEHQGRGVGLALWEASVAEFKGRGCESGFGRRRPLLRTEGLRARRGWRIPPGRSRRGRARLPSHPLTISGVKCRFQTRMRNFSPVTLPPIDWTVTPPPDGRSLR